jgi:PAS domain S-box-containing protein
LARVIHPDDLAGMRAAWAVAGRTGAAFQCEFRLRPAAGGPYRWFLARAVPLADPGGPAGWLGTSTDIDDQKQAQTELQLILDTVPALIFRKDRSHRLVRVNNELARVVGLPRAAIEGRTDSELGSPHADGYRAVEEEIMRTGRPARDVVEPLHTFTGTRWLQTTKLPYRDAAGQVTGVLGFAVDVSERKAAEDEVRRLNAELEQRVRSGRPSCGRGRSGSAGRSITPPSAWPWCPLEGRWLKVNRALCQLTGYAPDELLATDFQTITHPDDLGADLELVGQVLRGERDTYQMEKRYLHKAGSGGLRAAGRVAGAGPRGAPLYFVSQVKDVTERRRAERAMRESEERYRVLFEHSSDAHLIFDEADGILDCNRAAVEMLRCADKRDVLAVHPAVLSPEFQPDGRRSLEKCVEMDAAARRNGHHRFDWLHRRFDGETFPCEVTLTPVALGGRTVLLVVWHDLTARKAAEDALRASEERFRLATGGGRGRGVGVERPHQPDQLERRDVPHVPGRPDAGRGGALRGVGGGGGAGGPAGAGRGVAGRDRPPGQRRAGVPHPPAGRRVPAHRGRRGGPHQRPRAGRVGGRHQPRRNRPQRNRRRLGASEQRFRAFMDNSPAIAYMVDEDGRATYMNEPMRRHLRIAAADWLGKDEYERFPADLAREMRARNREVIDGGRPVVVLEHLPDPDGAIHVWRSYKFPVAGADGRRFLGGLSINVTAEHRAERALRASEERHRVVVQALAEGGGGAGPGRGGGGVQRPRPGHPRADRRATDRAVPRSTRGGGRSARTGRRCPGRSTRRWRCSAPGEARSIRSWGYTPRTADGGGSRSTRSRCRPPTRAGRRWCARSTTSPPSARRTTGWSRRSARRR